MNFHESDAHSLLGSQGFDTAIVSLPDTILYDKTNKMLDSGFYKTIMLEKPGAVNSHDLTKLCEKGEKMGVELYINYQRSFDSRINNLFNEIKKCVVEGYNLNYVRVYSCDKE